MKNRSFLLGAAALILLSFVALAMAQGTPSLTPPDMSAKMKAAIETVSYTHLTLPTN